jgi:hypothetical protein
MTTFTLHSNILFSQKSCVWLLAPVRLLPPPPQTPTPHSPSPFPKIIKIWRPPLCWKDSVGGGEVRVRKDTWEIYDLSYMYLSRVLCLSPCLSSGHIPVVVAERWAILYVLVIKLTKETTAVSSVVALMNYISSGLLWRIFCQTGTFRGVFSPYISFIKLEGSAQQ